MPIDLGQIAIDFAAQAGLNVAGCRAVISTTGRMHRVEVKDDAPTPNYKLYTVMLDAQGCVRMALNSTLTYRRAKKLDTKPQLSESERRKMLDAWVKRWPVPSGYVVTSFNPRTQYGDAELTFDRKVNGYWMGRALLMGSTPERGRCRDSTGSTPRPATQS